MFSRGQSEFNVKSVRDLVLDVTFIQNRGYHLESGYVAANQPRLSDYTGLVQAGQQWSWVTKPGFSGFGWASVAPFPNVAMTFGPIFYVGSPLGNTDYQSLQFTVKKRTAYGLSMQASYNLSSSHGDVDDSFEDLYWGGPLQDVYNLQQERHTVSDFDQTHIVKGYVFYPGNCWARCCRGTTRPFSPSCRGARTRSGRSASSTRRAPWCSTRACRMSPSGTTRASPRRPRSAIPADRHGCRSTSSPVSPPSRSCPSRSPRPAEDRTPPPLANRPSGTLDR